MTSQLGRPLRFGSRRLRTTAVFETYWRFAAERQNIFFRRLRNDFVLTLDPILIRHRFTNAYRAADRVSQFLVSVVIAGSDGTPEDTMFRTLLFKIFNKIETWCELENTQGELHATTVNWDRLDAMIGNLKLRQPVYSAAYIMPSPPFGAAAKHTNHLRLLKTIMDSGLPTKWAQSRSLRHLFSLLLDVPSFGPFLAFQFAIDLNYSPINPHSEASFVVAGPGARGGISKCFEDAVEDVEGLIMAVCEAQEKEFADRGIVFHDLWGRQLQPIDCQNLFCEVDKYARLAHPEFAGRGGRTKIKQLYRDGARPAIQYEFPTWWRLETSARPDVPMAFADVSGTLSRAYRSRGVSADFAESASDANRSCLR